MKNLIGSVPAVIFAVAALLLSHTLTSGGALKLWRSEQVTLIKGELSRLTVPPTTLTILFIAPVGTIWASITPIRREHVNTIIDSKKDSNFCCWKQLCAVGRPPPFLDTLSISAVVLEVGALQNVGEWFEVPKKHRRKFDYISYNHIYKTTYIIWYDIMYQSARETEEKAAPCNHVHPRHPHSQPCHRTWGKRVS